MLKILSFILVLLNHLQVLSSSEPFSPNFSYSDIRISSKLSRASYTSDYKGKRIVKLGQRKWEYYPFKGKSLLGTSYEAGMVAFSPAIPNKKQQIFIVFRGTETVSDIVVDIFLAQKTYHPFDCLGNIHNGFLTYFQNSINEIKSIILQYCFVNDKSPIDFKIVTTGHSLGGALATITGFDLLRDQNFGFKDINNVESSTIRTITFGAPSIGDHFFSSEYNEIFGTENHLRFVFPGDIVPKTLKGYQHVGKEYLINHENEVLSETGWKDYIIKKIEISLLNHSMQNYFDHIKLLLKKKFLYVDHSCKRSNS